MTRTKMTLAVVAWTLAMTAWAQADETTIGYNQAPGTCTKPIAIPANNKPVLILGAQINGGDRGTGQVTLIRTGTGANQILYWSGYDGYHGLETGFAYAGGVGYRLMYLDGGGYVDVESAASTHIQVCNSSSNAAGDAAGYLTFMY
ncbi:MAG TPA: hypothetical protein VGM17_08735 [Rhizomicrobium sp.]